MKTQWLLGVLIVLSPFYFFFGQTVEGRVVDAKSMKPISFATIILKKENSDVINKISTNENGIYKFSNQFERGNYDLEVSSIGYVKKKLFVPVLKDTILNILITADVHELEEVIVVKEKTKTELYLDKKVINVGQDLLSSGGNALTVLERIPEIQADSQGNISLRGNQNINVLVNGKPSPLSVTELLKQIPANNINKIEIITSPSAKYTASGLTGIINIITNKKVASGFSINSSGAVNSLGGYSGDADVNIGGEKVNYSFGIGYVKDISNAQTVGSRQNVNPILTESDFKFSGDIYRTKGRVDWFVNKSNELSLGFNYNDNKHKLFDDGVISKGNNYLPQENVSSHSHKTFDFTANYRHTFSKPENYLELDLYLSNNANLIKNEFKKNIGMLNNFADDMSIVARVSADYTTQINKAIKLEAGLLWERQGLDNNFSIVNLENNMMTDKQFQNVQSTYASYGLLKFDINKFNIQAGLRGEIFRRDANLITEGNTISNEFINLFPSLHVGYKINEGKTMSFGFNRRTSRPTLTDINPNSGQSSNFMNFIGSPDLQPEFSNNFDLNFQLRKSIFSITSDISYQLRENVILTNSSVNEKGITMIKPFNGGNTNAFGVNLSATAKLYKWWDSSVSVNWNYETSRQRDVFFFRNFSTNYSLVLQNDIRFSKKAELGVTWKYNSTQKSYLSDNNKYQNVDIAFRYKMMNNNGNLMLRFADIFNTKMYEGQSYGMDFVNKFRYKPLSRAVYLSFTYNFKKGKKANERNIKVRDYKNDMVK